MPEQISVVGCGYVGLVTAIGLAEQGHRVLAYDIDPDRIQRLRTYDIPMLEPGVEDAARSAGDRLTFHDAREEPWQRSSFTFLAVPTPQGEAGYPNLSHLRSALIWIADSRPGADADTILVIRSTVPPGTARWARLEIERLIGSDVPVLANPEFLQEGRALDDFRRPSRIVIGAEHHQAAERMRELMTFTEAPVIITDPSTAELAKYGSNAFLAVRVSFANELARLAEREGADPLVVLRSVGLDPRLGSTYLHPGIGYGGSCLPKDVAAIISMGEAADEPMALMRATQDVNETQRRRVLRTVADGLGGLNGSTVAILGLAFKPDTNDVRESPGVYLATDLRQAGATVVAWDPSVTSEHLRAITPPLSVSNDLLGTLKGADAAVLCTEWQAAVDLDMRAAARLMSGRVLVDGRYRWDARKAALAGLDLLRIGGQLPRRPPASP